MKENGVSAASPPPASPSRVADRIARQTLARRGPDYAGEVRRLLDAGLGVMRTCGTTSRPRVADIVAAAGLSNDAFYRHFASKEALVAAILEDGTERLGDYLAHQMAKESTPEGKVGAWVAGVLSQAADDEIAAATLAVLWNAGSIGAGVASGPASASGPLAVLLREPFAALGSADPELDASLAAHAAVGRLGDHLWRRARPARGEIEHIVRFCLAAPRSGRTRTGAANTRT
ncbi:MAG TPA: TetR/AcrR family transcriptional regulator [Acidimicrobiales bacterium]|nr:TetR/AcrR family transcriptional regulator [Acidimicrobiales bacterium]